MCLRLAACTAFIPHLGDKGQAAPLENAGAFVKSRYSLKRQTQSCLSYVGEELLIFEECSREDEEPRWGKACAQGGGVCCLVLCA